VNLKRSKGSSAEQTKRQENLENFWPIQSFNQNSREWMRFLQPFHFVPSWVHCIVSIGLCLFILFPRESKADEEKWIFLASAPLFQPLVGDLKEPNTSLIAYTNESRFEGDVGATAEIVRYLASDKSQWATGIFGTGTVLFDETGDIYPMRVGNWFVGIYLSESYGSFSNRFEYEHESSHLGDSLQGVQAPIIYNGENINFSDSFKPWEDIRIAAQIGFWVNGLPADKNFYEALEGEFYTPGFMLGGSYTRFYTTAHLEWKDEAGGILDTTLQLGVQFKFKKEETRDLRVALIYYDGNSEFGQFYLNHDEHVGIGVYFDP
jgi:hypothetical protein